MGCIDTGCAAKDVEHGVVGREREGEPEVDDFDIFGLVDEDVLHFEIAVHDAFLV